MFEPRKKSSPRNFLNLEDGQSVKGVFRGPVHKFYQHWSGGRPTVCPGRDQCDLCLKAKAATTDEEKANYRASFRFRVNFVVKEEAHYVSRLMEQGARVYDQLAVIGQECDLLKTVVKIVRHGAKGMASTTYMIMPTTDPLPQGIDEVPLQPVSDEEEMKFPPDNGVFHEDAPY